MLVARFVALGVVLTAPAAAAFAVRAESGTSPIRIVATQAAKLVRASPPPSRGPYPSETSIAFVDARNGLVATGGPNTPLRGFGRIQRTVDGGQTWTTVWSRRSTSVGWVGFVDPRHAFAAAAVETVTSDGSSGTPSPLLLRSD